MSERDWYGPGLKGAVLSEDRRYRYSLWRRLVEPCGWGHTIAFIGLNPSTADESEDDRTMAKLQHFTRAFGFRGLVMLNLFAFRATEPKDMKRAADPVGEENDRAILEVASKANTCVVCWGADGLYRHRWFVVRGLLRRAGVKPLCFGLTKTSRQPKHPLFLPASTGLVPWEAA